MQRGQQNAPFFLYFSFLYCRMKNGLWLFLFAIFVASLGFPQSTTAPVGSPPSTKAAPKKAAAKSVAGTKTAGTKTASTKAASTRTASAKTGAAKKGKSAKKSVRAAAAPGRARQMAPTPERYRDIQQALVDKGYLKSEPNGVWDAQSADALRQFQIDQKLSPTGKLSSASLIALGLGPKTNAPEALPPPAPPVSTTPVPTPEN
jgi:Putative peptidoglycan binding domain